jgi:DNA-binding Lrp family transcriptional regulator
MARTTREHDLSESAIVELAKLRCTNTEIARVLGCSTRTLRNRFKEVIAKGREEANVSLRHMQWRSAENGNVTMQIWLGKQYLGQTDKVDEHVSMAGSLGKVKVVLDANWYDNANRLSAAMSAAPEADPAVSGEAQDCRLRETVGQNRDGTHGNGHGPRPYAGGNGRGH